MEGCGREPDVNIIITRVILYSAGMRGPGREGWEVCRQRVIMRAVAQGDLPARS